MKTIKVDIPDRLFKKISKISKKRRTSLIINSFKNEYSNVIDSILQAEIKNDEFQKKYNKNFHNFANEMNDSKKEHDDYIEWSYYNSILETNK